MKNNLSLKTLLSLPFFIVGGIIGLLFTLRCIYDQPVPVDYIFVVGGLAWMNLCMGILIHIQNGSSKRLFFMSLICASFLSSAFLYLQYMDMIHVNDVPYFLIECAIIAIMWFYFIIISTNKNVNQQLVIEDDLEDILDA